MTERGSFYRKIAYLVAIAVLLIPISRIGAPSTVTKEGKPIGGGMLDNLREEHSLGESNIGEIDPASVTMRLATLGLRGVAVSWLNIKANEYKKKENWTSFRSTLEQVAKLNPYIISTWRFQAWNLSYNVSVELDDVRDRYYYVRRGIEYLKEGTSYNRDSPYLLAELGWFIGNKIGTADEKTEYRRLFRADEDFHEEEGTPPDQRDNWLVARSWYEEAIEAVNRRKSKGQKNPLGKKNPVLFYSDPGRAQRNYAEAIEREGTFGNKAKKAWSTAGDMWRDFGKEEFPASTGIMIRLSELVDLEEDFQAVEGDIESLFADHRGELRDKIRAEMPERKQQIADMTIEEVPDEDRDEFYAVQADLNVSSQEVAEFVVENYPEKRKEARRLAYEYATLREKFSLTKNNFEVCNYGYWKTRCDLERTAAALEARSLAFAARRAFREDADLVEAKRMFEECFQLWAAVFNEYGPQGTKGLSKYEELKLDSPSASDVMDEVEQYVDLLDQMNLSAEAKEKLAREFPLWNLVEMNSNTGKVRKWSESYNRGEYQIP